eukprot:scaffold1.g5662.t1
MLSAAEIINTAELHVYERALYKMPERRPQPNGVLDPRLGVSSKKAICETCGQALADCTGHFGYIKLELPVFHIGYFKNTLQILQCICKTCARVLLPEAERRTYLRRFRSPRLERVQREGLFKRVLDRCKRVRDCPHCEACEARAAAAAAERRPTLRRAPPPVAAPIPAPPAHLRSQPLARPTPPIIASLSDRQTMEW